MGLAGRIRPAWMRFCGSGPESGMDWDAVVGGLSFEINV